MTNGPEKQIIKLNLGCGSQVPDGWINVDYALGARLSRMPFFRTINKRVKFFDLDWDDRIYIHDLTVQFPWKNNTVDVVYSSHSLEHFPRNSGRRFLQECYRVLRRNGIIRVVVPDLATIVGRYYEKSLRADEFVQALGVLFEDRGNWLKNRLGYLVQYPHACMYDTETLLTILGEVGFDIESKEPYESDIQDVRQIELAGRTKNAVIVEGRKL